MKVEKLNFQHLILYVFSALLSIMTIILGAPFLLVGRRLVGRLYHYIFTGTFSAALISVKLYEPGLFLMALAVVVDIFFVTRSKEKKIWKSGTIAVGLTIGLFVIIGLFWGAFTGVSIEQILLVKVNSIISQIQTIQPSIEIDKEAIFSQLPSGILIILSLGLWMALVLEKGVYTLVTKKSLSDQMSEPLTSFALPESVIWIAIASLAGAFINLGVPALQLVSVNCFNIFVVAYFFQGLAVIATSFNVFKVGFMWRVLFYFLFIFQLFLVVSVLGLLDYWFEFRKKILKKTLETIN